MIPEAIRRRCVFCLENHHFSDEQILVRSDTMYLCAPLGQLVEGYLVVAPYHCGSSLNTLPAQRFPELDRLVALLEDFYQSAYGCDDALFYEQGRAGGGLTIDPDKAFPLHAHLCGLPVSCDLHGHLGKRYQRVDVSGSADIPAAADGQPYLYVRAGGRQCVYRGRPEELERFRLTPQLAELLGFGDRATWRQHPGREKLDRLLQRFGAHTATGGATRDGPRQD